MNAATTNIWEQDRLERAVEHATREWRKTVPARYRNATFDTLQNLINPHIVQQLDHWCSHGDTEQVFAVLLGTVGTYKTTAACAIGDRATKAGLTARFMHMGLFFDELRPGPTAENARQIAYRTPLLILDDLGVGAAGGATALTDWEAGQLDKILSHRDANLLRTVVTTNATPNGVKILLGDRLTDRLRGSGLILPMVGQSARGKK